MKHNWEYKRLGDVCFVIGGSTPKTDVDEYWNGNLNWFTPSEINEQKYYSTSERKITLEAVKATGLTLMPAGTVLLTSRAPIGKVGIATEEFYCNQGFKNLICKDGLLNEYLYYTLIYFNDEIKDKGRGATFKEISKKVTEDIEIPVPPMSVQEQIVAEFDKINEVIADCRKLFSNLDTLAQSLFYDYFGDPVTNPKGWLMKTLGTVSTVLGGSTPKTNIDEYWNGEFCWITPAELKGEKYISDTERHITELGRASLGLQQFPINTVLLTSRAPIGKVAIAKVPMYCNQGFKNLICDATQVHYQYVYFYLSLITAILNEKGSGATFKEISKRVTESVSIPVPPLELQEKFAERIDQIDRQKKTVEETIKKMQTLLDSRMDYWFN